MKINFQPASEWKPGQEGVYLGLDAEVYHKAPGVSQSTIKRFAKAASPKHFREEPPLTATEDMQFGTVCHTAVLEPEKLEGSFYVRPESYPDKKTGELKAWAGNAGWCKDWIAEHGDKPVLTARKAAAVPRVVEAVKGLPEFGDALKYGRREVSFFKLDAETDLLLKCRTDVLCQASDGEYWIFDLKKVQSGCGAGEDFSNSIHKYGYHIQAASYMDLTGAVQFVLVPFDDDAPFCSVQHVIEQEDLGLGLWVYREALKRFAECVKTDVWPGYPTGINRIGLPPWAKRKIAARKNDQEHALYWNGLSRRSA